MFRWHIVTSEEFRNGSPVAGDMYFLSDTREIYRGADPFTESVIMYTDLPNNPAINRLYINSNTLEGKIWQGIEKGWTTVVNAVSDTVTDQAKLPVSGKAVVAYVAAEIAKVTASKDTLNKLSWDSANHTHIICFFYIFMFHNHFLNIIINFCVKSTVSYINRVKIINF